MWNNDRANAGFTLLELVVSIAIMGMVGGMIGGFMLSGIRHYQHTDAETKLQLEAQLAGNQIQDHLIDANKRVQYYVAGTEVKLQDDQTDQTSMRKLRITNEGETREAEDDEISCIEWEPSEQILYYSEGSKEAAPRYELARHVTGFYVDLSELETKQIIYYHLDFAVSGSSYSNDYNVTLRNALRKEAPSAADPGGV
ncbi:MAG: prepilin-type N-terminal cleavage/methylation domain-containing protein [Hungatella sp.]